MVRYTAIGHPVAYWKGANLILHEPVGNRQMRVAPFALDLLTFLRVPRTFVDVTARYAPAPRASLRSALTQLERAGLIRRGDAPSAPQPLDSWQAWAPHASAFHFATKDPRMISGERRQQFEDELLAREAAEPPGRVAESSSATSALLSLPKPGRDDRFSRVVRARRTWRVFGPGAIALPDLSEVLHIAFGAQRWARSPVGTKVPLTTSPSAGARQPLAAYLAVRRVAGLRAGLYRYDAAHHGLEPLGRGMTKARLDQYLGHNWWFADAAVAVFITGRVGQVAWRYNHPRAYRFLLLEAGHVCQTFLLACTWKKLAPFCTAALADSMIERDLGIDGFDELVLYAAGVGTRPTSGYQQWPDHDEGRPYVKPKGTKRRSR